MNTRFGRCWMLPLVALCLMVPSIGGPIARRDEELQILLGARAARANLLGEHEGPPMARWMVEGFYRLGAPVQSAAWGRLPFALCGVLSITVLYALGRTWVGRRRARAAGFIAMTSLLFLQACRSAGADLPLFLLTMISALCGARGLHGSGAAWLIALPSAGLSVLAGGMGALAIPACTWLIYGVRRRGAVSLPFRLPGFWLGLAGCVAIVLATGSIRSSGTELALDRDTTLYALLPWATLVPFALWTAIRLPIHRARWALPLAWFLATGICVILIDIGPAHALVLLAGSASLLSGCAWHARDRLLSRVRAALSAAVLVGIGCAGIFLLIQLTRAVKPFPVPLVVLCGLSVLWALVLLIRFSGTADLLPRVALLMAALIPAHVAYASREGSPGSAARWMAQLVALTTPSPTPVICAGPLRACSSFYANRPASFVDRPAEAWSNAPPGSVVLMTALEEYPDLSIMPEPPALQRRNAGGWAGLWIRPGGHAHEASEPSDDSDHDCDHDHADPHHHH